MFVYENQNAMVIPTDTSLQGIWPNVLRISSPDVCFQALPHDIHKVVCSLRCEVCVLIDSTSGSATSESPSFVLTSCSLPSKVFSSSFVEF